MLTAPASAPAAPAALRLRSAALSVPRATFARGAMLAPAPGLATPPAPKTLHLSKFTGSSTVGSSCCDDVGGHVDAGLAREAPVSVRGRILDLDA